MSFEEWYDQHFGSADPNVVQAGNIDLGDRPAVYNEDGTVSTERSFSIQDDPYGREVLLPQVVGGQMLSQKDAIKHYRQTGEHLGIYKDIPTADAYAKSIHERIPRLDTPDTFPVGNVMQSIRDLPGWAAYRMYRGATRNDLPGEGLSAREEAALPGAPMPQDWSFSRAVQHFSDQIPDLYNQLKQSVFPPGFSAKRGWENVRDTIGPILNDLRQPILSDESIEEIKRNPYSVNSLGSYLNAAISLSGGKGGREVPMGPRPVPRRVWDMWSPTDHPQVKVDELGNQYKATGTHYDKNTGESHIIVDPIVTDIPSPQDKMISDLAKQAGNDPTTWEQLTPWQKEWFENQWKLGNTPSMKDVPPEGTGFGSGVVKPEYWQDNPFQKFLNKLYPKGTSGPFPDPETLPPGELGGGASGTTSGISAGAEGLPQPPSKPLKPEPGSAMDDLQKSQELQKAVEDWKKKHGGLNPFEPPPSIGDDFPEMPPGVKPENYWGNLNHPRNPDIHDFLNYWDNLTPEHINDLQNQEPTNNPPSSMDDWIVDWFKQQKGEPPGDRWNYQPPPPE